MKKFIYFGMMVAAVLMMAACSSDSTPSGALKTYMSALQDRDYEKFTEGINVSGKATPEEQKAARATFAALLSEKGGKELDKNGGLKGFEILSEEIAEDGKSAIVKFKQIYNDGTEKEDEQKMVEVDGKWLMDISK